MTTSEQKSPDSSAPAPSALDRLDQSSGWRHPYMIYVVLTALIFIAMIGIAYWALNSDLLPKN